jgi:hypothetical protein
MGTFETSIRSSSFWCAVVIPPTLFWMLVQWVAHRAGDGTGSFSEIVTLIALANVLPLAALGWMLCSVAAYTITSGKLIEHRVVGDREFAFGGRVEVAELSKGVIAVRLDERTVRLRVKETSRCLALLRDVEAARHAG